MRKERSILLLCFILLPFLHGKAENRLTVLTWNTARMDFKHKPAENEVLQYLLSEEADVVCLQEADVYKDAKFLTLPDVKQTLGKKYPYSYLDFSVYNKRHQYGTMVWSKYPLINKQSIHYQSRGNLSNRCDIVVGKDTFRLFNNHLESYSFTAEDIAEVEKQRNYEGLLSSLKRLIAKWQKALPVRNEQAKIVRQEIEKSPYPVIVVGDFNAPSWSFAYWHISAGLHDAWNSVHPWSMGFTCIKRGLGLRIDYILCSNPITPASCTLAPFHSSDHKPVVAELDW